MAWVMLSSTRKIEGSKGRGWDNDFPLDCMVQSPALDDNRWRLTLIDELPAHVVFYSSPPPPLLHVVGGF